MDIFENLILNVRKLVKTSGQKNKIKFFQNILFLFIFIRFEFLLKQKINKRKIEFYSFVRKNKFHILKSLNFICIFRNEESSFFHK